jgi:hypothetical protein
MLWLLALKSRLFIVGVLVAACGGRAINGPGVGAAGTTGQAGAGAAGVGAAGAAGTVADGAAGRGEVTDGGKTYPAMAPDGRCVSGAFSRDGACMCQPDYPVVCSAGCTDTLTDNDNCGACDTRCGPTSTCVAGVCGPAPTVVSPPSAGCTTTIGNYVSYGLSLAISGETLYVADAGHGTVTRVPLGGGAATVIASNETAPHAIAAAGDVVVWIAVVAGQGPPGMTGIPVLTSVLRGSVAGAATDLATVMDDIGGIRGVTLSADGGTAYYSAGSSVYAIPTTGGTPTQISYDDRGVWPGALAVDGAKLALTDYSNGGVEVITLEPGKLARCDYVNQQTGDRDPSVQVNCRTLARGGVPAIPTMVLIRGAHVYWADLDFGVDLGDTDVSRSFETIAQSSSGDVKALAISADKLYFAHDDVIERLPLSPSARAQPIARKQKGPASLAVDATKVYWGNDDDCSVAATDL